MRRATTIPPRIQGVYYVLTGVWPLARMPTFEAVTGPKTDDWLVRMVGLLAAVIGGVLLLAIRAGRVTREVLLLAAGTAASFAIDIVYASGGRISPIYLADAVVELGLGAAAGLALRGPLR